MRYAVIHSNEFLALFELLEQSNYYLLLKNDNTFKQIASGGIPKLIVNLYLIQIPFAYLCY